MRSEMPSSRRSNSWKYRKQHRFLSASRYGLQYRSNNLKVSRGDHSTESWKRGGNAMPTSRTISANSIDIFLLEQVEGPLVVLCHGWPALSYSWRHRLPAIAAAGIRVVATDMRRIRRSSAPAVV